MNRVDQRGLISIWVAQGQKHEGFGMTASSVLSQGLRREGTACLEGKVCFRCLKIGYLGGICK